MAKLKDREKRKFKYLFDQIETKDNFKEMVYWLYANYEYSYWDIVVITRYNYKHVDTIDVIEILKEYDIKRCNKGENCKNPDGCVQSRENFSNCQNIKDGKQRVCKYCNNFNINFKRTDQTKQNYMLEFQKIKEVSQQDDFLINLYKKTDYTYQNLAIISLRNIQNIISLLEKADIKKCSEGDNCKSPNGYIQSRENFSTDNTLIDGKHCKCSYCKQFDINFKNSDLTRQNDMLKFQKLELNNQDKFLIELYTKKDYTYNDLTAISSRGINNIISLLEKANIKKCSEGDDCKNPDGCVQSRENFHGNENINDKKCSMCFYCHQFKSNFKNSDLTRQNDMLEFQKLELNNQDKFLINLYTKKNYTYNDLTAISLRGFNNIISLLEKADIKRCPGCEKIQSRKNFSKCLSTPDKLLNYCKTCQQKYYLENKEHINKQSKLYYLKNTDERIEHHRIYRNQFGKYSTFAYQLEKYEKIRRDPNNLELIQVTCKKCNEWFNPTNQQLQCRKQAINGDYTIGSEYNFYCSKECKYSCPLYETKVSELIDHDRLRNNNLTKEDFERMQNQLRQYWLKELNPDHCDRCGENFDQEDLILHHIISVADVYIFEADPDNLMFVCQDCHKLLHQKDGCRLNQLSEYSMENKLC